MTECPRRIEGPFVSNDFEYLSRPDDGTCDYCGSLMPDVFMASVEAGDVVLVPTDKNYKVYVMNNGGEPFKRSHRIDEPSKPGEIMKDPRDQTKWIWTTREIQETKFYFEHLSEAQRRRFIELLNEKKLFFDYPGRFYRLPFFCSFDKSAKPAE